MNGLERHRLSPLPKPDRERALQAAYYRAADEVVALERRLALVRVIAERNFGDQAMRQIVNVLDEV